MTTAKRSPIRKCMDDFTTEIKISRKGSMNATRYMSKYTHKLSFMLHFNRNILTLTTKSSFTAIPFIFIPLLLKNFFFSCFFASFCVYFMYINKCINKKKCTQNEIYFNVLHMKENCYTCRQHDTSICRS